MGASSNSVITTSLVVNFDAGGGEGILTAEIDDRPDGMNQGNTSFVPGDEVGFLIYKTSNVVIDEIVTSLGSITDQGSDSREIEEDLIFAREKTANSQYPIVSLGSYTWIGNNGGVLLKQNETTFAITADVVAIARTTYTTNFLEKKLIGIPITYSGLTKFSVVIYVAGHIE